MAVMVYIPTPYRQFTGNVAQVEAQGGNVLSLVQELEGRFPGLRQRLLGPDGRLYRHLNIYVNDELVDDRQGIRTPLHDGDQVAVIPPISGG